MNRWNWYTKWHHRHWLRAQYLIWLLQQHGNELSTFDIWEAMQPLPWPLGCSLGRVYSLVTDMQQLGYIYISHHPRQTGYTEYHGMVCTLTDLGLKTPPVNPLEYY